VNQPYSPPPQQPWSGQPPQLPGPGQPPPYQQPTYGGQPGGQVVQVWTKGRAIPLLVGLCGLALLAAFGALTARGGRAFVSLDVIAFAILVFGVATALRRKLTLTRDAVIVRKLFVTRRLPLREIVNVNSYVQPGRSLVSTILDLPTLEIRMADRKTIHTMSLGRRPAFERDMVMLARAAKAAGSPIDI
jgi:hypothetical protein